jgi:hypothetical protein
MSPIISEKQEDQLSRFVFHYRVYPFIALIILFFIVVNIFLQLSRYSVYAATEYTLPYPGILPNHRLYPLKSVRDRIIEMFTREPSKKAELYLLYADKRINMAQMLGDRREWELSETTASKAEKYLLKLQSSLEEASKMGGSPEAAFLNKTVQAAGKHRKILLNLRRQAPPTFRSGYQASLKLNSQFSDWIGATK